MRETKDQTITRLKRVNTELTEKLRAISRQNRSARREERDSIIEIEKKYKTEITNLKNEVIKLQDQIEDERNVWKKELDETKRLLHYWKHKRESKTNNVEERRREEGLSILERDKRERDKVRLEYFEGELWEDKYHYHFFDPYTLILKINPHTGQELNINGTIEILNLIENNSYYVERLEMIQHYLDDHDFDNDYSSQQKVYDIGMDIYRTLYSDFPFDQHSV